MQGSKVVERTTRTRTKTVDRVKELLELEKKKRAIEKLLELEKKKRAIKARAFSAKLGRPLRRGLKSIGVL